MDQVTAQALADSLRGAESDGVQTLDPAAVATFHPWARGKPLLGVFRHELNGEALHLLVVDWKRGGDNYYLVVFSDPTAAPVLEAHRVNEHSLLWRYTPKSRDGRNLQRLTRFTDTMGTADVRMPLPSSSISVGEFLRIVRAHVRTRRDAENLPPPKADAPAPAVKAWIFQANPNYFDLKGALAQLQEQHWLVNQHAGEIKEGHTAFLWLSGKAGGLLARATILTAPAILPAPENERPFTIDESALPRTDARRVRLRIDQVLDRPLDRDTLRGDARLAGLMFLRVPQGTNFPVDDEQCAALLDLMAGNRAPRVVKIAPGELGMFWEECLSNGYICVGWDDVGDLSQYADKATFRERFRSHYPYNGVEGAVTKKANELWTLRELKPSDIVIANRGMSEVLGVGKVVEPGYSWRADRSSHNHTVSVDWDSSVARRIPKQSAWGTVTVTDVPAELYRALIIGRDLPAVSPAEDHSPFTELYESMQDEGLSYSQEVVSAYLLALQTKRFVILTGISGTGKTRLALAAAKALGSGTRRRKISQVPEGAFTFTVRPYMHRHNRLILPTRLLSVARMPEEGSATKTRQIETEWPGGRRRLSVVAAGKTATMLSFSGEFRAWFESKLSLGETFYIELVETTEDSPHGLRFGIPKQLEKEVKDASRYLAIAVRPDWTDNRGLLGYYNPILEEYVTTDFMRLLLRAGDEEDAAKAEGRPPEPHFIVLDEMNLARVEHYFSDFLSAIESGEPIELHNDDDVESGEKSDDVAIPKSLRIPSNVYFTGTVNVDETTYMFSPKVLDRAFVIELNLVDLEGFGATSVAGEQEGSEGLCLERLPTPLQSERLPAIGDWQDIGTLLDGSLRRTIVDIHRLLERQNRHFGYRVANEIGRFILLAAKQCHSGESPGALWAALDLAILFKVLPKMHGTQQELEDLLASLFVFATTEDYEAARQSQPQYEKWQLDGDRLEPHPDSGNEPARLPRTAAKLYRMADVLRRRGFTSFIE